MFEKPFTSTPKKKDEEIISREKKSKGSGFLKSEQVGDADNPTEVLEIYNEIGADLKEWRENFTGHNIKEIQEVCGVSVRIDNSLNDLITHRIDENNTSEIVINENRLLFIIQRYLLGGKESEDSQNRILSLIIGHELAKIKAKQINPDLTSNDYYTLGIMAEQEIVSDFKDYNYEEGEEFLYEEYEGYIKWMHKAEQTDFIDLISEFDPENPIKYLKDKLEIDPGTGLAKGFSLEDYGVNAVYWASGNYEEFTLAILEMIGIRDQETQQLILQAKDKDYKERTEEEAKAYLLFIDGRLRMTTRQMDALGKKWLKEKFSSDQLENFKKMIIEKLKEAKEYVQFVRKDIMQPPYEMMSLERELEDAPVVHGLPAGASSVDVANEGLIYGWPLPYGMVGTQGAPFSLYRYKWAGYNFGYAADSVEETGKTGDEYSSTERCQVFMKTDGVEVYQRLDKEKQVIFWGKGLETEKIMPLRFYDKRSVVKFRHYKEDHPDEEISVEKVGYYLSLNEGNLLYLGNNIGEAYRWLDKNYDRLVALKKVFKSHEPWPKAPDFKKESKKDDDAKLYGEIEGGEPIDEAMLEAQLSGIESEVFGEEERRDAA